MAFSILIIPAVILFCASVFYLYVFSKNQERFLRFWGGSWIAYSASLICLLISVETAAPVSDIFLQLRKIIDMFNLLLLMFGAYSFIHVKTPAYWYRFSLYLLLLAAICIKYEVQLLSFYLPISVYQIILTVCICFIVLKKWSIPRTGKAVFCAVMLLWGLCKAIFPVIEIFTSSRFGLYVWDFLLYNAMVLCFFSVNFFYIGRKEHLEDSLYRRLVENSRDVIFYYKLTPYRAFEYISPSVSDCIGFSPADFYNDPKFYRNLASGVREEEIAEIEEIFTADEAYIQDHIIEISRANNETFWAEFHCKLIYDESGQPIAIEGTIRDVTEAKSAEMENLNATRSRNMLLSYISHELRSPITSIAGYLTAIGDGTFNTDEERSEAMSIITEKTLTLKKLIDDLDQLSKMETNQFTFDFTVCTAAEAAEMMIRRNIGDAEASGFTIKSEYDLNNLENYWIAIDKERINQVFSNLLNNSIKYSADNKDIFLKFEIDKKEENFMVTILDHGIGIREGDISHIFDKFYRVANEKSDGVPGRGLGLPICKEIISAHQGQIYVESRYGNETVFSFIIPVIKEV